MKIASLFAALAACALCTGPASAQGLATAPLSQSDVLREVRPLSEADAARYREAFAAQEKGDWKTADRVIGAIEDPVLLGYLLEQRYMHPTAYRSSYRELARWLDAYADHPNAGPVHRLALRRRPVGETPRRPAKRRWRTEPPKPLPAELEADYRANPHGRAEVRRIELRLRSLLSRDRPTQALNYLNEPRQFNRLTRAQTDRVRGWIAESFYFNGKLSQARALAVAAADRSPDSAVLAHWIAGLSHMRMEDPARAYSYFARMAAIEEQTPRLRAAGAYWAARTAIAAGRADAVTAHLETAAGMPLTLYGQLALGQLGRESGIDWTPPVLTVSDYDRLTSLSPRIARAAALAQIGHEREAQDELRWVHAELPQEEDTTLAALTHVLDLPTAQLMIALSGGAYEPENAQLRAGLFPVPDYAPNGGFTVDRALLFALIRQESKFMTHARSRVGAAGLMQLMPRTAAYISRDRSLAHSRSRASDKLYEPGYNMQLGQSYVEYLLSEHDDGSRDLFAMMLSYNWGPGNYRRWQARNPIDDPLLRIESVPNPEARGFVDHVMTNLWLYRERLGEPAPSRDALAAGGAPVYRSVSEGARGLSAD
ncbi:lytic transglycosylase domain-containing protein [Parvularcula oceani]|uniref:lytic transglycosylase domain-containing protein n=1 Tax=Parvularcula oceani TaxID=1247963 RepID=UPI0004E2455D|nr:lytic transglycosylase domain-containing protein [Parvularcula oceani]